MKKLLATVTLTGAVVASPLTAFAAPQTMPDGTIFDAEYYAQNNPDVVAALGTDAGILYQHYVMSGKNEGRLPYAQTSTATNTTGTTMSLADGTVFDPVYYAQNNPDVVAALGTDANLLAQHYLQSGKAEGRKPSAGGVTNQSPVSTATKWDSFDYDLARMNRFMKSVFLGDEEETGWVFDYEAGLKENQAIVITNSLNDQLGVIYDRQGITYADPALVFERKDWSGDPVYQRVWSEMVESAKNRSNDTKVILNPGDVAAYAKIYGGYDRFQNLLDNLAIDFEKAGYADYVNMTYGANVLEFTMDTPVEIQAWVYYDYRTTDMFENYADYDYYGRLVTSGFDEALLRRHPELTNVLAWMKQN